MKPEILQELDDLKSQTAQIANKTNKTDGFVINHGKVFDNFQQATSKWTLENCTVSKTPLYVKHGVESLKVQTIINGGVARITKSISRNFSTMTNLQLWVYIEDVSKLNYIAIYLSSVANFAKSFNYSFTSAQRRLINGWNILQVNKSEFSNSSLESWDNIMNTFRIAIVAKSGMSVEVSLDALIVDTVSKPKCVITFDGGWIGQYTKAFPIMENLGIKGSSFVTPTQVGLNGNFMDTAQLISLQNAGWVIGNHSQNHLNYANLSIDEIRADIADCITWLKDNGLDKYLQYFVFPYGGYEVYKPEVKALLQELGIVSARGTMFYNEPNPVLDPLFVRGYGISNISTLASVQPIIDNCVESGSTFFPYIHNVADSSTNTDDVLTSAFTDIVTYLAENMDCITYDEWYRQLIGLEYVY